MPNDKGTRSAIKTKWRRQHGKNESKIVQKVNGKLIIGKL